MSRSEVYLKILAKYESPDASYLEAEPPLIYDRAEGSSVWDVDGRSYLDLCAGFGVLALGHHHPIQRAVYAELLEDRAPIVHGMGDVYSSASKAELLQGLANLLPADLSVGSLALSGSQAVELALKTAFLRKPGVIISFEGAYHGLDLGVLPLSSRPDFRAGFEHWLASDWVLELPFGASASDIEVAIASIKKSGKELSAILVEPIQGRAGIRPAPQGWLSILREQASLNDALLIYDEVFTGLGRCGQWSFAQEVPCDLLCLGKALGGGLPLSACFSREDVMAVWPQNQGEAIHTGTFFGHPLSCRLALATLNYMLAEDVPRAVLSKGLKWQKQLEQVLAWHPEVCEIRGQGLMQAIVMQKAGQGVQLMHQLRRLGVIALVSGMQGEVLSLTPALTIREEELELAVGLIERGLEDLK